MSPDIWTSGYIVALMQSWSQHPGILLVLLLGATFILEDLAVAAGALLASGGVTDPLLTILALASGIYLGDLGLYGLGRLSRRQRHIQGWIGGPRLQKARAWLESSLFPALLAARLTPGARLPGYAACGLFAIPFSRFSLIVFLLAFPWTCALFLALFLSGEALLALPAPWNWLAGPALLGVTLLFPRLLRALWRKSGGRNPRRYKSGRESPPEPVEPVRRNAEPPQTVEAGQP